MRSRGPVSVFPEQGRGAGEARPASPLREEGGAGKTETQEHRVRTKSAPSALGSPARSAGVSSAHPKPERGPQGPSLGSPEDVQPAASLILDPGPQTAGR
ncbi:unnamed protein product [Rangifer tarandus platyrhynchus]|uniref:Uncharacterized protein n=1 Tax=Rangifer tarandus platyrhynchus TaxID=3082113 RepID=A0AC59Z3S2_RANTA